MKRNLNRSPRRWLASALIFSQIAQVAPVAAFAAEAAATERSGEGRGGRDREGGRDGEGRERPRPEPGTPGAGRPERPDRPRPEPTPEPRPDPRPDPRPEPTGPSSAELEAARADGRNDGNPDGAREGRERGWDAGIQAGRQNGYRQGYDRCVEQRRRDFYDRGYLEGQRDGSREGQTQGQLQGFSQGQVVGARDGEADGDRRANFDARAAAAAPATEQGRREAEATDSYERGAREGDSAGVARAQSKATQVEYPRGREAYRTSRLNEPVSEEVGENLSAPPARSNLSSRSSPSSAMSVASLLHGVAALSRGSATPDYRYARERGRYSDPQLRQAYSQGYRSGYQSGFQSSYSSEFRRGEDVGEPQGREQGCREAERVDVRNEFRRGRDEGYRRAYRESFDRAYAVAYRLGYDPAFQRMSEQTYQFRYAGYYATAYEEFRLSAYGERVNELYRAGYAQAESAAYERSYPGFAQVEFDRGVRDETAVFEANPIRFMESGFREQFEDSVIEPGETLGFWFFVRNFADSELSASDLKFEVETSGNGLLPLRKVDVASAKMPARGAIRVSGAIPVIVSESALNQSVTATVRVFWKGSLLGTKSYRFDVRNRATIEFAERPTIREGLESTLKVRIRNNSSQPINGPIRLELRSDSRQIQIRQAVDEVGALAPGEERLATFRVVGRSDQDSPQLPLAILATDGSRKRLTVKDFSGSVPVVNDYRVKLLDGSASLRRAGVTRLNYEVRNVSSRLVFGALELYARVLDANGKVIPEARWIGFNPQFLLPLERGEKVRFVIPVVMPEGVSAGTVELEIRENGVPVVIHQASI